MIERLFLANPWIAALLNMGIYLLHYYLSLHEAQLYHAGASRIIAYEIMAEPPPGYDEIVVQRKLLSRRAALVSLALGAATIVLWWAATQQLQRPEVLTFFMGGWLLVMSAFIVRMLGQITMFRYWRSSGGASGKLAFSERQSYLTSAVDFQVYAATCLALFLVVGDLFFLGGAFLCFVTGRRRRDWGLLLPEKYPLAKN